MSDPSGDQDGTGSFFSRWSRRKSQVRQGQSLAEPFGPATPPKAPEPRAGTPGNARPDGAVPASVREEAARNPGEADATPARPRLTLNDVEQLTPQSDFSAFAGRDVDPSVRNAAMKKLFHSDPHFNVMDGLDVYIDDYNTPDPLPKAIMRTMLQARALGLLDDELKDQDKPEPDGPTASPAPADTATSDENTDLQLQPNDAAGLEGAGDGAVARGPAAGDESSVQRPDGPFRNA